MLDKRKLGSTGIQVSPLGLGTVKFGRNQGVKYPESFEIPEMDYLARFLAFAKKLGINTIDTAPAYGESESRLGTLLAGQREDWVIVGKAGEEFEDGESEFHFDAFHLEKSLHRSLERLKTAYLDVFLIHSDGNDMQIIEEYDVFGTLANFKQQGLIKAYGMSTKTVEGGLATVKHADVVMCTYNSIDTGEEPVIDLAQQLQKGVLIKKALSSGHIDKISHADPIQHTMNTIFQKPAVSSVIVGSINPQHLRENAENVKKVFSL